MAGTDTVLTRPVAVKLLHAGYAHQPEARARGTVRITDFGIAYAVGSAPLTATGTVLGTPGWDDRVRLARERWPARVR